GGRAGEDYPASLPLRVRRLREVPQRLRPPGGADRGGGVVGHGPGAGRGRPVARAVRFRGRGRGAGGDGRRVALQWCCATPYPRTRRWPRGSTPCSPPSRGAELLSPSACRLGTQALPVGPPPRRAAGSNPSVFQGTNQEEESNHG